MIEVRCSLSSYNHKHFKIYSVLDFVCLRIHFPFLLQIKPPYFYGGYFGFSQLFNYPVFDCQFSSFFLTTTTAAAAPPPMTTTPATTISIQVLPDSSGVSVVPPVVVWAGVVVDAPVGSIFTAFFLNPQTVHSSCFEPASVAVAALSVFHSNR